MPRFEVNTRTVDVLYNIAESSDARCRDTTLLIEDLKQKSSEYEAEGERGGSAPQKAPASAGVLAVFSDARVTLTFILLHSGAHLRDVLLHGVGLSHTSTSKPTSDYLSALVDTAMVLGIRDTSLSRYLLVTLAVFLVLYHIFHVDFIITIICV